MKVLSWNIRGLNSKGKQRHLKEKLQAEKPQVMLLQKTKVSGQKLQLIMQSLKLQYEVMTIDSAATSEGIAVLWNEAEVSAEGWIACPRILSAIFRQIGSETRILISVVYGPPIPGERSDFIKSIRTLSTMHQEKYWLLRGDFNMILNLSEKKGGIRREDPEMALFRELLHDLRLVDIPTVNGQYTWNNRRGERHQVASRLDQFLAS
jgi:exonuclease III